MLILRTATRLGLLVLLAYAGVHAGPLVRTAAHAALGTHTSRGAAPTSFHVRAGKAQVNVGPGATLRQISRVLEDAGVTGAEAFLSAGSGQTVLTGRYRLEQRSSPQATWTQLLDPAHRRDLPAVTVSVGMRSIDVYRQLATIEGIPLAQVQQEARGLDLPVGADTPEGYLYPAVYDVLPGGKAGDVLQRMVDTYTVRTRDLNLAERAAKLGLTSHQAVTLASIAAAETLPGDWPRVSRTVLNRLALRMPLQLDSSVNYALGLRQARLSARQLATPSVYNTYLHPGLPPGPFGSVDIGTLDAVLDPAPGSWRYWVTTDLAHGTTRFATSYAQFAQLARSMH